MNIRRIVQKFKNIYHLKMSILANFCFLFPSRKITVIGVTGTNGKTTTVQMIGKVLDLPVEERLEGTAATVAVAIQNGANIVRVHDVLEMKRVARMTDAILRR